MDMFDAHSRVNRPSVSRAYMDLDCRRRRAAGSGGCRAGAGYGRSDSGSRRDTLESVVVTARRREERLQDTPIAVTALSARGARAPADHLDDRSGQGRAESAVPLLRNADRQQFRRAGLHSRHRPDGCDARSRSWRRNLYRRGVHGARGWRRHGVPRHRQRAGSARAAGHAVRPQHHRWRRAADDQCAGREMPETPCGWASARTICASCTVRSICRSTRPGRHASPLAAGNVMAT